MHKNNSRNVFLNKLNFKFEIVYIVSIDLFYNTAHKLAITQSNLN